MYTLEIKGKQFEVRDWSHGIKVARGFVGSADYARGACGDYEFCELGQGAVGLPVLRSRWSKARRGRHKARKLGIVVMSQQPVMNKTGRESYF